MVEICIYLCQTSENCQISLFTLFSVSNNHLLLGQYLRPSLKGSWHQPTNTTPVSPGAQNACRDGDRVEWRNMGASKPKSKKLCSATEHVHLPDQVRYCQALLLIQWCCYRRYPKHKVLDSFYWPDLPPNPHGRQTAPPAGQ